jgi:FMN-dependent NADH-azoreductase
VFGFFGIADVEFVRAEGLNISPDHKRQAIEAARREIAERELTKAA